MNEIGYNERCGRAVNTPGPLAQIPAIQREFSVVILIPSKKIL
jgi:hypothetical protein